MLCHIYKNVNCALWIVNYFLSLQQKLIKQIKTFKIMAEDKNKLKDEEQLQEEQLDKVSGGHHPPEIGIKKVWD